MTAFLYSIAKRSQVKVVATNNKVTEKDATEMDSNVAYALHVYMVPMQIGLY